MSTSNNVSDFPTVTHQEIQAHIREGRRLQSAAVRDGLISVGSAVKSAFVALAHAMHVDGGNSARSAR